MVAGLSDSFEEEGKPKKDWKPRKEDYLARLVDEPENVLLISVADKLYNAKAILDDLWTRQLVLQFLVDSRPVLISSFGTSNRYWRFSSLTILAESGANLELSCTISRML